MSSDVPEPQAPDESSLPRAKRRRRLLGQRKAGMPTTTGRTGCVIILKSGKRFEIEGMSVGDVKHRRRLGLPLAIKRSDGTKAAIDYRDIEQLLPLT